MRASQVAAGPGSIDSLVLTFDVGAYLIESGERGLRVARLAEPEDLPDGAVSADEEEPWWALLGHPLVRARELDAEIGLQFRPDEDSPRTVTLATAPDGGIAVAVQRGPLA